MNKLLFDSGTEQNPPFALNIIEPGMNRLDILLANQRQLTRRNSPSPAEPNLHDIQSKSAKAHVNAAIAITNAQALAATSPPTLTPFALFWTSPGQALLVVAGTTPALVVVRSAGSVCSCEVVAPSVLPAAGKLVPEESSRVSIAREVAGVGSGV
jgi:hypothetical protein